MIYYHTELRFFMITTVRDEQVVVARHTPTYNSCRLNRKVLREAATALITLRHEYWHYFPG